MENQETTIVTTKNYFKFNLTGQKLLPYWLACWALIIIPYTFLILNAKNFQPGQALPAYFFLLFILFYIGIFVTMFYIAKMLIENIEFKSNSVVFKGTLGKYFGEVIVGILLSMITFGIYGAWFIKNLHTFFVDGSSLNSESFKFKGTGGKLFVILLLTFMLPFMVFMFLMVSALKGKSVEEFTALTRYMQLGMIIIMIPYMYFAYKWMVNVQYKNYNITWETNVWESLGKIALEIFLSIITLGLYFPMAHLKLYKYFAERTIAESGEGNLKFGYDIEPKEDYIFIFIQTFLSVITLGIYYPWAMSKIGSRILSKTYLEKI